MATPSWLQCHVLDYGDEQPTMPQTPATTTCAKRAGRHDASTMTTTLPDDILVEIFSRLPSKSASRFRYLSRSWAATLTSAPFVDLHLRQANHRPMPKVFSTAARLDDPKSKCSVRVLTKPCHGLVLLRRQPHKGYYVCNPSTGQLLGLPDSEWRVRRRGVSYGLGYSPATREYKVVRLLVSDNSNPCCEVFTLDVSAYWRAVAQKPPLGSSGIVGSPGVLCGGYLHFLLRQQDGSGTSIVTFDVVDETFGSLMVPPAAQDNPLELAVLDGCLCLCVFRYDEPYCIWRLVCREAAGRWEKLYRLMQPQTTMPGPDLRRWSWVSPLEIYPAGNGQKKIMFVTEERVLLSDIRVGGAPKIPPKVIASNSSTGPRVIRLGSVGLLEESLVSVGRTSEEIMYSSPWRKAWSDVLKWMPTRSVVALMCVCKEWRAVISSDLFTQTHALHANLGKNHNVKLVYASIFLDLIYRPLESCERVQHQMMIPSLMHEDGSGSRIVCSKPCKGLVFVRHTDRGGSSMHYLCNPTRECSSRIFLDEKDAGDTLGLGYDCCTNKHVLVRIVCYKKGSTNYQLECYVQQLTDTTSWISITPPPRPVADMQPVYADGKLYWMVDATLGTKKVSAARCELLALDVGTREFEVLQGPPCNRDRITSIIEFQGSICILCSDRRANAIDVWKLERGFWSIDYRIELAEYEQMYTSDETTLLDVNPKDGRILLSTGRALGYYDPKTRALQTIYYLGEHLRGTKFAPALCEESLICPRT